MLPDYSRQQSLKEIGAAGQARLASSRVLVVGAGGLGSPVLQYLAGAGVGCIGIVDADVLDASNLHRQPLYCLADVGRPKAALAKAAVARLNPTVRVETHEVRFDADNAVELVAAYDLVIDCSDNFRTKFLVNDAAVLARKPAVFASVYQYEGQLQVYKPDAAHACLRCLWPDATADGIVGNCAEAGVLGPVPGAFGAMQALLALKILIDIPGQLGGEMLLINFMNFTQLSLKAPRRAACGAPACSVVRAPAREIPNIEIRLRSLGGAEALGFEIIDIRNADEVAVRPVEARHIAMAALLADPTALSTTKNYLLVCASGKRSAATARELSTRGYSVKSLAGGLQSLES
ncbi:MAG: HesA/MoeB/ThiF family protein [Steroidobacteraceae bacterium]|jgi:adenylyltransferase/sulfurtransferase